MKTESGDGADRKRRKGVAGLQLISTLLGGGQRECNEAMGKVGLSCNLKGAPTCGDLLPGSQF